jgi:two-component system response regulator YesN
MAPEEAHTLSDFAAKYGYSADYIGRIFSREVGISFSEYLANTRINKAKFLLSSTELSVEGVAEALGYYDTCYFIRQFKRITGTSPGRYRKGK